MEHEIEKNTDAKRPKYKLSELVAECDLNAPVPDELRHWEAMEPVGREVIPNDALSTPPSSDG